MTLITVPVQPQDAPLRRASSTDLEYGILAHGQQSFDTVPSRKVGQCVVSFGPQFGIACEASVRHGQVRLSSTCNSVSQSRSTSSRSIDIGGLIFRTFR